MSVEFDNEIKFKNLYDNVSRSEISGLAGWLIKKNIVKDEKNAKSVMVIIVIVCFALSIFFLLK